MCSPREKASALSESEDERKGLSTDRRTSLCREVGSFTRLDGYARVQSKEKRGIPTLGSSSLDRREPWCVITSKRVYGSGTIHSYSYHGAF